MRGQVSQAVNIDARLPLPQHAPRITNSERARSILEVLAEKRRKGRFVAVTVDVLGKSLVQLPRYGVFVTIFEKVVGIMTTEPSMNRLRQTPFPRERCDEFAARLVVMCNAAYSMELVDGSGPCSLVDYKLRQPGGQEAGVLEVGRNTDQQSRKSQAAFHKHASGGVRIDGLNRRWEVTCERDLTSFRDIPSAVAPLLRELESLRIDHIDTFNPWRGEHKSVKFSLRKIGIVAAWSSEADDPVVRFASMHQWSALANAEDALQQFESWINCDSPDVRGIRRKLMSEPLLPERHVFVWVDVHQPNASYALSGTELPPRPPNLPSEVTHVWLVADSNFHELGGWFWSPRGWSCVQHVEECVAKSIAAFSY